MHIEPIENEQADLGNSRLAYILGTTSLVVALCTLALLFIGIFISLATGLCALVLCSRDVYFYKTYPGRFTLSSYKQSRSARRRAIVGLLITVIWLTIWAVNYGKDGLN
ncbi:hypothetical protein CJD36_008400 [Flavipsychrobacter stenotrophus]|uniref:Uncharacterized protein n=1 Tax=Flavipsychrobacter stenotrophus TaxID=2077091 RepID=A0A2S7SYZ8_9BACT|nr:hypothetical protein [Flavipsychrobacter stenotrophus]PQJ11805.1 hypothetical protein CJD36_008400 [Flavipsychrobacter stenotrophus]